MRYGVYEFRPCGKLKDGVSFEDIKVRSRASIGVWDKSYEKIYGKPVVEYDYDGFYNAMGNVQDDLFRFEGDGNIYVPSNHELMLFEGYKERCRRSQ